MARAKKSLTAKGRQTEVPGTETPSIPEIDDAALEYREVRDKRMDLSKKEKAARDHLAGMLEKHGVELYRFITEDDEHLKVEVVHTKIKIRVRKDVKTGDDGEEGAEVVGDDE